MENKDLEFDYEYSIAYSEYNPLSQEIKKKFKAL